MAVCEYESGALGVIECTTSVMPWQSDWLELHGEKGSVLLENYKIQSCQIERSEPGEQALHSLAVVQAIYESEQWRGDGCSPGCVFARPLIAGSLSPPLALLTAGR
ncbi:MAG TPA: hypothetical protein VNM48_08335 [Chloroflexota bacterium]|nr:hypothetical protein [Chloroflexota bacterium]